MSRRENKDTQREEEKVRGAAGRQAKKELVRYFQLKLLSLHLFDLSLFRLGKSPFILIFIKKQTKKKNRLYEGDFHEFRVRFYCATSAMMTLGVWFARSVGVLITVFIAP